METRPQTFPEMPREVPRRDAPHYASYLLRVRCLAGPPNGAEDRDGGPVCQVMLQNVATQERRYFDNLASLIAFLEEETGSVVLHPD